jgi:Transglutaminase-like superfamily
MTPIPRTSSPTSAYAYTAIAQRHKDGSVLLSIADDRICKLNGVGALTWMILEESPASLSVDEVVGGLSEQFDAINAEGELRYDVSPEQLREDTARFLGSLTEMNLLQATTDSRGQRRYSIKEGVSGTTSTSVSAANTRPTPSETKSSESSRPPRLVDTSAKAETSQPIGSAAAVSADEDIKPLGRETFTAFIGLAAFDLLLKFGGFQSLIRRVERWPIAKTGTTDPHVCKRVRAIVDRAQMYYPKKAMCLQHSAVTTCLLRRRSVPAAMVLAAQEFPPKGHAWAEAWGEVVNDSPKVKVRYREIRRI